jgi:hypothetical protein
MYTEHPCSLAATALFPFYYPPGNLVTYPFLSNVMNRVGASTRPGNGVPLVMIGARLTSEAVIRDRGQLSRS